jgi:hypothetical protein
MSEETWESLALRIEHHGGGSDGNGLQYAA